MKRKHEQTGLVSRIIIIIILYWFAVALKGAVDGNTYIKLHLAYVKVCTIMLIQLFHLSLV